MANFTQISATNICNLSGTKLALGVLSFQAVDGANKTISFQPGGGGQTVLTPSTTAVVNGAIGSFFVANPANTLPAGIFYHVTVTDSSTNQTVIDYPMVTFTGDTFNLDTYAPSSVVSSVSGSSIAGPLTILGNLSVTGTLLSGAPGAGAETKLGTFSIAATTWTLVHSFGTQAVQAQCYDNSFNVIFPDSLQNTDVNTTVATFLQSQVGYMVVVNVGNWTPSVASPNNIIGNPTSSQSITGQSLTLTSSAPLISAGNNSFTGSNTFKGLVNCKNLEASIFCVDTTNTQGWAGSDPGAWINAAITALPSTGGQILIASGQYSITTPITGAQDATIVCPTGASMGSGTAMLNFIPATGALITWSNSALNLIGCTLKTTTSTTSIGLKLITANYTTNIERNHINGFFGGMLVTGDGSSTYSTGVHITNNLIDGINARCGAGAGYGISLDHARDITYDKNEIYSVTDCATGIPMIIDTGVGGMWMSDSTFEQGLHAGIIRNTNQGGAYGGAPAAIWGEGITWDLPPGGDALLFDSTLGTADIRFFCTACWAAGAGMNNLGTVITPGAIGFNVQGGSNIHFSGGTSRVNASWGALAGTAGTNISFEGVNVHANNQGNTAGVGGIKIAGPTGWRVANNRSGNVIEAGGHQAWGVDLSGASTNGIVSGNDLRNNTSGRINYPAGVATAGVDAPEFGSGTGLHFYGPSMWLEQPAPSGIAGEEVCYGDSTSHTLKCSYNNGLFFSLPQAIGNGIAVMTTAGIATGACGTTVTVAATNVAATDVINISHNAAVTIGNGGGLTLNAWPTAGNVNFNYCNSSAGTITPTAMTINWQVTR